jgi:hypothetical protein
MQNVTASTDPLVLTHPFTTSGLGRAPFRFIGFATIPSPSLGEQNPTAYSNALAALPRDLANGCGSCAHCGTPIMNICIVQNADGKKWGIGCDCIRKTDDAKLVRASVLARRAHEKELRRLRAERKRAAWLAEVVDQATGETRAQRFEREAAESRAAHESAEAARIAKARAIAAELTVEAEALNDRKGGFSDGVAQDLFAGVLPTGRRLEIAVEIIGKRLGGRSGSKAYEAAATAFAEKIERLAAL